MLHVRFTYFVAPVLWTLKSKVLDRKRLWFLIVSDLWQKLRNHGS
jgi:hypothetical protein